MKYCSNCGQELAPEAKFCSNCGAPVQPGASSAGGSEESDRERERREDFERAWGSSGASSPGRTEPITPPPSDETYGDEMFAEEKPTWEIERERMRAGADDEWSMSDLGPPRQRRRRTWLWVLLGIIALTVIACCVFFYWITATESGTQWFEGVATQAAEDLLRATENAATPVP